MAGNTIKVELFVALFIAIALILALGLFNNPQTASDNNAHSSIVITGPVSEAQPNGVTQQTGFFPLGTTAAVLTVQPPR